MISRKYNLEERSAVFAENVFLLVKKIPRDEITKRLIPQLVASSSAIGANYCEADCAESNKDFIHKMSIANKEIKETKFYLRIIAKACPQYIKEVRKLWKESYELNLIFSTIIKKSKERERLKELKN